MKILRMPAVKAETGYSTHTSIYDLVKRSLFTQPVRISARSVGWPSHEVAAINIARVAGKTEDEIRALVKRLHAQRQEMAQALEAEA